MPSIAARHLSHCCASFADFYSAQDFDDWLQGKYQGVLIQCSQATVLAISCIRCICFHQKHEIVLLIWVLCLMWCRAKVCCWIQGQPCRANHLGHTCRWNPSNGLFWLTSLLETMRAWRKLFCAATENHPLHF